MESELHGQQRRFLDKDKPCPAEKTIVFVQNDDRHEDNEESHAVMKTICASLCALIPLIFNIFVI